jgi:hypothetical protein
MLNKHYAKYFKKTYFDIYTHLYQKKNYAYNLRKKIILKNLREIKFKIKKNFIAANIGTGLESSILKELGFSRVYNYDIINRKNFYTKEIIFKKIDFCKKNNIKLKFDLIYLYGVIHHFYDINRGLNNILKLTKLNSVVFFRIYRSGSLKFFIVCFARLLLEKFTQKEIISSIQKNVKNNKKMNSFYSNLIDDLSVPILLLLNIKDIDNFFLKNGFKKIYSNNNIKKYLHSTPRISSEGTSLAYKKIRINKIFKKKISHINQLEIHYDESYIKLTVNLMKKVLLNKENFSINQLMNLIISLYKLSDASNSVKLSQKKNHFIIKKKLNFFINKLI